VLRAATFHQEAEKASKVVAQYRTKAQEVIQASGGTLEKAFEHAANDAGAQESILEMLEDSEQYALALQLVETSKFRYLHSYKALRARALYRPGQIAEAAAAAESVLFESKYSDAVWLEGYSPDYLGIVSIYEKAGDEKSANRILRIAETQFLRIGLWQYTLGMYFDAGQLADLERVAREEDELECAIIAYEAANQPEEALRIYEEIAAKTQSREQSKTSGSKESESRKRSTSAHQERSRTNTGGAQKKAAEHACHNCGASVEADWVACPECAADLTELQCSACGEPLKPHWKRCPACGTMVA